MKGSKNPFLETSDEMIQGDDVGLLLRVQSPRHGGQLVVVGVAQGVDEGTEEVVGAEETHLLRVGGEVAAEGVQGQFGVGVLLGDVAF